MDSSDDACAEPGAVQLEISLKHDASPFSTMNGELCEACKKIDFDAVMFPVLTPTKLETVWSRGPIPDHALAESARSCKLCQLFIESFEDLMGGTACEDVSRDSVRVSLCLADVEDWSLWSHGLFPSVLKMKDYCRPHFEIHIPDPSFLADRIQFCRRPETDGTAMRFRLPTPQAPFDLIRTWLDFCQCYHGLYCSQAEASTLASLRVIDCGSSPREVLPYCPKLGSYVALSLFGDPRRRI